MLKQLEDEKLLTDITALVLTEKETTLQILEYLSEIDSRRLYLREGYASLFDFCVRFLHYSEGEAARRIQAARVSVRIEEVKPLLKNNELSLTGLSVLSPFLNKENAEVLLEEVKHKSVRQIEKVIEQHFPESFKNKKEEITIELDEELKALLEKAKQKASEKDLRLVLKKSLREYTQEEKPRQAQVKKHTHYVQASIKRELKKQVNYRCSYESSKGIRCSQTAHLEIDHITPYAMGGSSHDKDNLRVLCKAHNLMYAREHFPDKDILRDARFRSASNAG